ncbi:glycosyltransferase family 4 protein [Desulfitobacterium sp. THU1]|uniref:glycosyltransferase family 4 protein n=1 Tax=Desulfitobacterium sp. THU1 TaxID=3138072 RepID=UPI00311DC335
MKIIFPVMSLEMGGGARFLYHLANALTDKGHDVEVVMPRKGAQVWPLRAKLTRVSELVPSTLPPGDFILPNFYTTVAPAWAAQKGKVVRLSLGYEPLWVVDRELAKESYLIDAPILSISQWHRQLILQETGRESTVISGGVDHTLFHPCPKRSTHTGRKNIFYILRNPAQGYTWKGGEDFFKSLSDLQNQLDFELTVTLPESTQLTSSIPCRIFRSVSDQEMATLYGEADLFIYNSYFEALGLPPLEAMSCGTAVITTDCGGSRDYANNGENCRVVPPSDIGQLKEAIYRLLTQDNERQRLATVGYAFAQSWTWQRTADQVETFLLSL